MVICPKCNKEVEILRVRDKHQFDKPRRYKTKMCEECLIKFNRGINLRELKKEALKRDNNICQRCFGKKKVFGKLDYIVGVYRLVPKIDKLDNLITLCEYCHKHKSSNKI